MEITSLMEYARGWVVAQGIMFWSAAGAVALGATLILTAGYLQFRTTRIRRPAPAEALPVPEPAPLPAPEPTGEADSRQLRLLLNRLKRVSDRLEAHRAGHGEFPAPPAEYSLKETPKGVDYLYRTGTG